MNCFVFLGNHEADVPLGLQLERSEYIGELAEWSKAPHSKRGKGESPSGVQISHSPQKVKLELSSVSRYFFVG